MEQIKLQNQRNFRVRRNFKNYLVKALYFIMRKLSSSKVELFSQSDMAHAAKEWHLVLFSPVSVPFPFQHTALLRCLLWARGDVIIAVHLEGWFSEWFFSFNKDPLWTLFRHQVYARKSSKSLPMELTFKERR